MVLTADVGKHMVVVDDGCMRLIAAFSRIYNFESHRHNYIHPEGCDHPVTLPAMEPQRCDQRYPNAPCHAFAWAARTRITKGVGSTRNTRQMRNTNI